MFLDFPYVWGVINGFKLPKALRSGSFFGPGPPPFWASHLSGSTLQFSVTNCAWRWLDKHVAPWLVKPTQNGCWTTSTGWDFKWLQEDVVNWLDCSDFVSHTQMCFPTRTHHISKRRLAEAMVPWERWVPDPINVFCQFAKCSIARSVIWRYMKYSTVLFCCPAPATDSLMEILTENRIRTFWGLQVTLIFDALRHCPKWLGCLGTHWHPKFWKA